MAAWLKEKAPGLHKFLTRKDKPWRLIREVLAFALAIGLFVVLLFGLTGQPLSGGYPVVVVTTGSMMHCEGAFPDHPGPILGKDCDPTVYGRIGSIDPGDLVFVRRVSERDQVSTFSEADAGSHYGKAGDVIVYRPHVSGIDTRDVPIIHRALFWVELHGDGTMSIPGLGLSHVERFDARAEQMAGCARRAADFDHGGIKGQSGFVTRGDNNGDADQCHGIDLVRVEHILGKAWGELPWIGLVKLFFDDLTGPSENFANAGGDSKVMLVVVLVVVLGAPWVVELVIRRRRAKRGDGDGPEPPASP